MQTTTLSFLNMHEHGALLSNVLRARKQSFIIQNRWELPESEGMEFDQYDTPQARHVAIHENGRVLAGLRLAPTTASCGIYSYMIRDAQRGLLGGSIPQHLLYGEAPVDPHVWEATRLFVSHDVPMAERRKVHNALLQEMLNTARDLGAVQLIAIVAAIWPRWTTRYGLDTVAMGPKMAFDGDVFQCIAINLQSKLH